MATKIEEALEIIKGMTILELRDLTALQARAPEAHRRHDAQAGSGVPHVDADPVALRRLDAVRPQISDLEPEAAEGEVLVVEVGELLRPQPGHPAERGRRGPRRNGRSRRE